MPESVPTAPRLLGKQTASPSRRTDSFTTGVVLLLAATGAQRLIGLGRSVLVCRWLPASEVGLWELAFSFLLTASPLLVLGLPGALGRYVGVYERRNQLRRFLRWSAMVTGGLATAGVAVLLIGRTSLTELIFNSTAQARLLVVLIPCILAAVAFNYSQSLLTALRLHRLQTAAQFGHTLLFAVFCVFFLLAFDGGAAGVLGAYGAASGVIFAASAFWLKPTIAQLPPDGVVTEPNRFWSTVAAFALWTWIGTTVANLFAVSDRYMIVHYSGLSDAALYGAVGQYHAARLIPRLLRQLAYAMAAMLVPHLTHAWESGRRDAASAQLGLTVKGFALFSTLGAAAAILGAPLLFDMLLEGKFPQAASLLPGLLVSCIWFGMAVLLQTRLWCAEKAWLGTIAFALGLVTNIGLNRVLLPHWGLEGAVWATAAGNLVTLIAVQAFSRRIDAKSLRGMLWWTSLPGLLFLGIPAALAGAIATVGLAWKGAWLVTPPEKGKLGEVLRRFW